MPRFEERKMARSEHQQKILMQQISDLKKQHPDWGSGKISKEIDLPETTVRRYISKLKREIENKGDCNDCKRLYRKDQELTELAKKIDEMSRELLKKDLQIEDILKIKNSVVHAGDCVIPAPLKREVVPVIVASDWHLEERVKASVTNGKNEYSLDIAIASVKQFFANAAKLVLETRGHMVVNTVILAVLGDIINGVLREEDFEQNQLTTPESIALARDLLSDGIACLQRETGCDIHVICTVGNHGRLTDKIFPSNQVRHSIEYVLYQFTAQDLKDNKKVRFFIPDSYYTIHEVFGIRIRFHHGHCFRFFGGIGGLSVPVLRKVSQLNQIEKADLDVCGHFHSMQVFPNVILNGSLVGANGYSIQMGMPFEPPRQTFFLIDSKYGRSTICPIFIDRDVPNTAVFCHR